MKRIEIFNDIRIVVLFFVIALPLCFGDWFEVRAICQLLHLVFRDVPVRLVCNGKDLEATARSLK